MKPRVLVLCLACLATSAGCFEDLEVDPGLAPTESGVIAGDAVVAVPLDAAFPVVLFLLMTADAAGTPVSPPASVNVTIIPKSRFAEGASGARTGPFAFGLVEPGTYIVGGIVDVDENFDPLDPALAMPSAPDLLGGHVDVATGALIPILVEPGRVNGEVTVMFAGAGSASIDMP